MDETYLFRFILLPVCDVFCFCMRIFTLISDMTPISCWYITLTSRMRRHFYFAHTNAIGTLSKSESELVIEMWGKAQTGAAISVVL